MIETYGYARAGFLGNPSDGYFGKTLSFAMSNFRARVLLYPSGRLEIKPSKVDLPVFENLDDLYRITRWRGYYGGIRIIQALVVRLVDYCREQGTELPDRNFTLEYESNVPQRLGLGGSSAIITASLRALCQYYELEIPLPVQANLALETETRELNVPAGLQDRVVQAYQGLVYMDFARALMDARGYGEYERMDVGLLPNVYVAYRTSLSEGTEVFHNNLRERWLRGDAEVVGAMETWAGYAAEGRACLVAAELLETESTGGCELRSARARSIKSIGAISKWFIWRGRRERPQISPGRAARSSGPMQDEGMFGKLTAAGKSIGVAVIKPKIVS